MLNLCFLIFLLCVYPLMSTMKSYIYDLLKSFIFQNLAHIVKPMYCINPFKIDPLMSSQVGVSVLWSIPHTCGGQPSLLGCKKLVHLEWLVKKAKHQPPWAETGAILPPPISPKYDTSVWGSALVQLALGPYLSGTAARAAAGPSCWGSRCCSWARSRTAPRRRSGCRTAAGRPAAPPASSLPTGSSAPWRSLAPRGRWRRRRRKRRRRTGWGKHLDFENNLQRTQARMRNNLTLAYQILYVRYPYMKKYTYTQISLNIKHSRYTVEVLYLQTRWSSWAWLCRGCCEPATAASWDSPWLRWTGRRLRENQGNTSGKPTQIPQNPTSHTEGKKLGNIAKTFCLDLFNKLWFDCFSSMFLYLFCKYCNTYFLRLCTQLLDTLCMLCCICGF